MHPFIATLLFVLSPTVLAHEACWQLAAKETDTTVPLLQAIAWTESSMNPLAVNTSHQYVTGTRDIGLLGVNTAPNVLRKLGVSESDLFDPCINVRTGARILKERFAGFGATWEAVGAYCVSCTRLQGDACRKARMAYAWRVYRAMNRQSGARRPGNAPHSPAVKSSSASDPSIQFVSLR